MDDGGEGAGAGVIDDGGEEEGSQWMARRFPLGRAKAQRFLPSRATVLWFLLSGRATKRRGEKNGEQGGGRQKYGRKRFILSNPTKIVESESRATFHASAQRQAEYARSAERVSKSCVF